MAGTLLGPVVLRKRRVAANASVYTAGTASDASEFMRRRSPHSLLPWEPTPPPFGVSRRRWGLLSGRVCCRERKAKVGSQSLIVPRQDFPPRDRATLLPQGQAGGHFPSPPGIQGTSQPSQRTPPQAGTLEKGAPGLPKSGRGIAGTLNIHCCGGLCPDPPPGSRAQGRRSPTLPLLFLPPPTPAKLWRGSWNAFCLFCFFDHPRELLF